MDAPARAGSDPCVVCVRSITGSPAASKALASPPELAKKNWANRVSRKRRSPIATLAGRLPRRLRRSYRPRQGRGVPT
jgi:hypothetical protein